MDISTVSPLHPSTLCEAGAMVGAVLEAMESKKHCARLRVRREASNLLAQVTARLAIHKSLPKLQASFEQFSNFNNRESQNHPTKSIELNLICD